MPILRRVLLLFARLAAVHHRRRRRSRHDTALLGRRGARRNALRGRSMRRPGGQRGHVDVLLHLPPAAGCLPCLHARRPRMPGRTQKLRPGAVDLKFPSVPRRAVPAIPSTAESSASGGAGTIESSYDSRGKREIESDALVSLPNHTPPGDLRGRDHGAGVGSSRNIEAVSLVPALRERPYRLRERRGGLDRCSIHLTRSGRTHDRRDPRQRLLWIQPWGAPGSEGCPGRGPAALTRGRSAQKVR